MFQYTLKLLFLGHFITDGAESSHSESHGGITPSVISFCTQSPSKF